MKLSIYENPKHGNVSNRYIEKIVLKELGINLKGMPLYHALKAVEKTLRLLKLRKKNNLV